MNFEEPNEISSDSAHPDQLQAIVNDNLIFKSVESNIPVDQQLAMTLDLHIKRPDKKPETEFE